MPQPTSVVIVDPSIVHFTTIDGVVAAMNIGYRTWPPQQVPLSLLLLQIRYLYYTSPIIKDNFYHVEQRPKFHPR